VTWRGSGEDPRQVIDLPIADRIQVLDLFR